MNIKALITTLILGSTSVASADSVAFHGSVSVNSVRPARPVIAHDDCSPVQTAPYHPVSSRPVYRPLQPSIVRPAIWQAPVYHPTNTRVGATVSQYTGVIYPARQYIRASNAWFDLSEPTRIDEGREFFTVGANKGSFRAIRLDALGNGRSHIKQVGIEFADGSRTQVVQFDTWIGRGNSNLTIDLDGNYRQIKRIIVYGATDQGSAYKLMAL